MIFGTPSMAGNVEGGSGEQPEEPHAIDSGAVVDAFADLSVACAVLAPDGVTREDRTRALALATTADIVVFDWLLNPPATTRASGVSGPGSPRTSASLIRELAAADVASGGRLRLLCIYTGNSDLDNIVNQVGQALGEVFTARQIVIDLPRSRIHAPNMLVLVVRKPHRDTSGVGVLESELPHQLVDEFYRFAADGLLPRLALGAISAVRESAHRVVARFDPSMDPAYLSHRALVGQLTGEEFALQLIAGELFAVLASAQVEAEVHQSRVEERLDDYFMDMTKPRTITKTASGSGSISVTATSARQVLSEGRDTAQLMTPDDQLRPLKGYASITSLALDFPDAIERATMPDHRLAMLSCLGRSPEFDGPSLRPPVLRLGTILRCHSAAFGASDNWAFWLCLQPLCDSVRLPQPARFPMLPLRDTSRDPSRSFDFVVPQLDPELRGMPFRLSVEGQRFRDICMFQFDPDPTDLIVSAAWGASSPGWAFTDIEERQYVWMGDLRLDLAHRTAANLSARLSRIGLDQSEFLLRRSGQR
jgi:hypothetical protein